MAAAMLLAGAAAVAGCSSAPVIDAIPSAMGGLPEGVPARPTTPQDYPAVHDMPPARAQRTLNEEERNKLRDDLAETRERAARVGANSDETTASVPAKPSASASKDKAANPRASGSARNP